MTMTKQTKPPKPDRDEWKRFETAMDAILKAKPQPKKAKAPARKERRA